jgi:hypothetical protein
MNVIMTDRRAFEESMEIGAYSALNREGSRKVVYELKESKEDQTGLEFDFVKCDGIPFPDLIRQEYPGVIEAITKKDPEYMHKNKYWQDARIYASADLPNWIKAMRDTQATACYMSNSAVGSLSSLNRTFDIQLIFSFADHDKEGFSQVKINLSGVDSEILANPKIKETLREKFFRYAGQFPQIKNENIRILFSLRNYQCEYLNEKTLTSLTKEEEISMAIEEFKELSRLFTISKFQLIETFEYFTKHPEKLKDTDYQTLLQTFLFKIDNLNKELQFKGFEDLLSHFIQHNYEQWIEENEIQGVVFMLKLAHQLHGYCPEQPFFKTSTDKLRALIEHKDLEADEKSLVYAELIAQLGHKQTLSEEEIITLVTGAIHIDKNQFCAKHAEDLYTSKEVREAILIHSELIKKTLERGDQPNQQALNRILRTLDPTIKEDKVWIIEKKTGEFPCFSTADGEHSFYPLLSKYISSREAVILFITTITGKF